MKLGFKKAAVVLALTGAAAAQAATVNGNLVVNGSFEAPVVNGWTILQNGALTGWTAGSPNGVEVRNQTAGLAQDGKQFVELDTTANSWISQVINTKIGQEYTLSFWYSPREGRGVATDNQINASINDVVVRTLTGTGLAQGHQWTNVIYTFVAGTASTTLKFAAAGASNSFGGSLDNVSLTATPLPGAALLFGTALAGFFGFSNRRKV